MQPTSLAVPRHRSSLKAWPVQGGAPLPHRGLKDPWEHLCPKLRGLPAGLTASLRRRKQLLLERVSLEGLALLTFQRLGQHLQGVRAACTPQTLVTVRENEQDPHSRVLELQST